MDGTQPQYHPGTRIPLNTLYVDPDTLTADQRAVSVLNDIKGVMVHAALPVFMAVFAGKAIASRLPTPIKFGVLVTAAAAIPFLPPFTPAACLCTLTLPTLPALPAAGFTLPNLLGTIPLFVGGSRLLSALAGAPAADKLALSRELPERRLLRRVANLGAFTVIGSRIGIQALGFTGLLVPGLLIAVLERLGSRLRTEQPAPRSTH